MVLIKKTKSTIQKRTEERRQKETFKTQRRNNMFDCKRAEKQECSLSYECGSFCSHIVWPQLVTLDFIFDFVHWCVLAAGLSSACVYVCMDVMVHAPPGCRPSTIFVCGCGRRWRVAGSATSTSALQCRTAALQTGCRTLTDAVCKRVMWPRWSIEVIWPLWRLPWLPD